MKTQINILMSTDPDGAKPSLPRLIAESDAVAPRVLFSPNLIHYYIF